jgi:hypothetical protein
MYFYVFKLLMLFALLIFFARYASVLGGVMWTLFALILRIPFIGRIYRFLFWGQVKMLILLKLVTWVANAAGLLLGLIIYHAIFGKSSTDYEFWILLIVASGVLVNFLYDVWYLEFLDIRDIYNFTMNNEYVEKYLGKENIESIKADEELRAKLMFGSFIDTMIPHFLRIMSTIGAFYYASYHLGLFETSGNSTTPTLYECIKYAYTYLPIEKVDTGEIAFTGVFWDVTNVVFGILIFLWIVVFFNVAFGKLTSQTEENRQRTSNEKLEAGLAFLYQGLSQAYQQNLNQVEALREEVSSTNRLISKLKKKVKKATKQRKDDD